MEASSKSVGVVFGDGERGFAESYKSGMLVAVGPRAYAPGQPLEMQLSGEGLELQLQGKSVGSRRREDGDFEVRIRVLNLRREQRQALEAWGA
ncbi:MAG: PilZ domain-containing protein [Myxococcales bacterium]|nr:PilZ domain-containing protein [Myxococcales bacterium]